MPKCDFIKVALCTTVTIITLILTLCGKQMNNLKAPSTVYNRNLISLNIIQPRWPVSNLVIIDRI